MFFNILVNKNAIKIVRGVIPLLDTTYFTNRHSAEYSAEYSVKATESFGIRHSVNFLFGGPLTAKTKINVV